MEYQKNRQVTVTIEDIGANGEGIGHLDGYTLFVKDALIGDTVEAVLTKVKKQYAYAKMLRILDASPDRIDPPCPVHRQCGGCQIQAMSYEAQLRFKEKKVFGNLVRIGGIAESYLSSVMEPIVGMPDGRGFRYRNKAQYPVGTDRDGKLVTGFFAGRTHDIIPCEDCMLGAAENREILERVLDYMRRNHVAPYHEKTGTGCLRYVMIRKGFASGSFMVCLVVNGRKLANADELIGRLSEIPGVKSIWLNMQEERTNVILGNESRLLFGEETIEDVIALRDPANNFAPTGDAVTYAISPHSFYQVNPVQTERMYSQALAYADLHGTETVWDLYCGIGTISLFMAKRAKQVCGVEAVAQAVRDAGENARQNGIRNASFFVGKAEDVLPAFYDGKMIGAEGTKCGSFSPAREFVPVAEFRKPDVIVVDPPRKGCDERCLETMVRMQPERIVYVSCDSATLARDVKYLREHGYLLKKVRAFDNFPQTVHVETVCLMSRVEGK